MNEVERRERLAELLLDFVDKNQTTGRQIAKTIGVSSTSANAYLDARTYPGEKIRRRIATLLGMTFEQLQRELGEEVEFKGLNLDEVCNFIKTSTIEDFLVAREAVYYRETHELRRKNGMATA